MTQPGKGHRKAVEACTDAIGIAARDAAKQPAPLYIIVGPVRTDAHPEGGIVCGEHSVGLGVRAELRLAFRRLSLTPVEMDYLRLLETGDALPIMVVLDDSEDVFVGTLEDVGVVPLAPTPTHQQLVDDAGEHVAAAAKAWVAGGRSVRDLAIVLRATRDASVADVQTMTRQEAGESFVKLGLLPVGVWIERFFGDRSDVVPLLCVRDEQHVMTFTIAASELLGE